MSSSRYQRPSEQELRTRLRRDLADAPSGLADADALARLLGAGAIALDDTDLAAQALLAARPEMSRRAAIDLRRRVFGRVVLALLPLPFVIAYAGYVLQALYLPVAALLSPDVAGYVASVHVALLALLFGTTYAAIPMMLSRSGPADGSPAPSALLSRIA